MRYTNTMKANGELACRNLSDKARNFYDGTDPLNVYEYEVDDLKLYAYDGVFGTEEGLTFAELQEEFEALADASCY